LECPACGGVVANPVGQTFLSESKEQTSPPKADPPLAEMSVLPTDKPIMPEADPPPLAGERFILQFS